MHLPLGIYSNYQISTLYRLLFFAKWPTFYIHPCVDDKPQAFGHNCVLALPTHYDTAGYHHPVDLYMQKSMRSTRRVIHIYKFYYIPKSWNSYRSMSF